MRSDSVRRLRGLRQNPRARLALVADEPDSAQARLARSIVPHLSSRYDAEVLYLCDYEADRAATPAAASELFHELYCGAYDLVHTFTSGFRAQVFERAIAAEPALADPEAVLERALKVPLTASPREADGLHSDWDRFAALVTDVVAPGQGLASWIDFFTRRLDGTGGQGGPLSDLAVWERVKAWIALVEHVQADQERL